MSIHVEVGDLKTNLSADADTLQYLRKNLRLETDYYARQHNPHIPKYNYLISKGGKFYTGLLPRVLQYLDKKKLDYSVNDNRSIKESPDMEMVKLNLQTMRIDGNPLELRDYQLDALIEGLHHTRGIFDVATGGGKSIIMASLILSWNKKTLVVIDSKDLATQLRDELSEYTQNEFGYIGSGIFNENKFNVAIDKTLLSSSNKSRKKDLFDSVEYLIFDECHHMQSNSWKKISRRCKNASIRHGFSGTPETSLVQTEDGRETQDEYLEAYLGPKLFVETTKDLIDDGWLAEAEVRMIDNDLYFDGQPLNYNDEYERIVVEDEERNTQICKVIKNSYENGEKVVGFVDRIAHGENIKNRLENEFGIPCDDLSFVHGSCYNRDEMIEEFSEGSSRILFGTVLSEGLNLACDVGINMSGGQSNIETRQNIGRILRKDKKEDGDIDKDEDQKVKLYDFLDKGHPWFGKHAKNRMDIYRSEGFNVNTVEEL